MNAEGPNTVAARLLSNGSYHVLFTAAGGGFSSLGDLALTRWAPDRTRDADGFFVYVRDLDDGLVWSAAHQPVQRTPDRYGVSFEAGSAAITRADSGVETLLEVCVPPGIDAELRRVTLTNGSTRARRLDLTTYLEVVLNPRAADASHPAYSKLFVQTAFQPEGELLLAWRRPRAPDEPTPWLAHRLLRLGGNGATEPLEFETDRVRFIGRGRTLANPAAMEPGAPLSRTTGAVLDPVFSLRRGVTLQPGERVELAAVLVAGRSRAEVEAIAFRLGDAASVRQAFQRAADAPPDPARARRLEAMVARGELPPVFAEEVERRVVTPRARPRAVTANPPAAAWRALEPLRFFNGVGGFSDDGTEYVLRLGGAAKGPRLPPLPWTNVIANESAGFIVSETGAGYTWSLNSRENRLTPWSNDPASDPHGEAIYLRDEDGGGAWSPMPGPMPGAGDYEARHGFGYTVFHHRGSGLDEETWQFVPPGDSLKLVLLRVINRGERPRRLSAFSYQRWVLGGTPGAPGVITERDAASGAILARNPDRGEFSHRVAFASAVSPSRSAVHATADRTAFLGLYGSAADPAALRGAAQLDGRTGPGIDPCAAFQVPFELAPGETAEIVFLLGEAESAGAARSLLDRYRTAGAASRALDEVRGFWRELTGSLDVETPSPAIDLMLNGWLAYQNLSCRLWGRSAFYQSGGAFGFRDQLQDASAFVAIRPEITRRQIVLHAGHQFVEGDVLHWWHPPLGRGLRTRFSDDLLWLAYVAAQYVESTGDASVLDEVAPYLRARPLEPGEDEAYLLPEDSGERSSVYEHACRALDRSLTRGAHGLPLMGTGDWNDGMNRVGRAGLGESVWLGFFLYDILNRFMPICLARGDVTRVERYGAYHRELAAALNEAGWDGAWYRRAYYDNGAPLGSAQSDECQIDAIAQAWAVLSGAAPPDRAERALDALEERLVSERDGIIRLLTPAFDKTPNDPGYIKGYLPGVRENGGQYTHGALWAVRALAEAGRTERAAPLLEMISPVRHAGTPDEVAVYRVEPYVIAADVYGVAPHVGRGGWTWYTGSAGWMFRVALESILGLRVQGGRSLRLRPCIPAAWPGFRVRYRSPADGSRYEVVVANEGGARTSATLDGVPLEVVDDAVVIPLAGDGGTHSVRVTLGRDLRPRYAPRSPNT